MPLSVRHSLLIFWSQLIIIVLVRVSCCKAEPLVESERLEEYHRRYSSGNNTWPPNQSQFIPNTPEWSDHMTRRLLHIDSSTGSRYDGYLQALWAGLLIPNFTQHGFGLCPRCLVHSRLWHDIQNVIDQSFLNQQQQGFDQVVLPLEHADATDGPHPAWLIAAPELMQQTLEALQPLVQAWVDNHHHHDHRLTLKGYKAYGLRLYRNESKLHMHLDQRTTHVISAIFHINSSANINGNNNQETSAWPLYIEDLQGRTHALYLEPGDVVFYESSKCLHGRPEPFLGQWYSSVFVHYYPTTTTALTTNVLPDPLDADYAVPPHWRNNQHEQPQSLTLRLPHLHVIGTSLTEPECPNEWCSTQTARRWYVQDRRHLIHRHEQQRQQQQANNADADAHAIPSSSLLFMYLDADGVEHDLQLKEPLPLPLQPPPSPIDQQDSTCHSDQNKPTTTAMIGN